MSPTRASTSSSSSTGGSDISAAASASRWRQPIGSLPAGQPVYFWTNWLEPEVWRQTVLKRIKEDDEVASAGRISAWFRKQTGMKIKEFTSLFGREFSFNIAEISTAGFFPVPKICFIIEVRDRQKVKQFLEKMIAGQRSPRNTIIMEVLRDYKYVDYRGMGIRTKVLPLMREMNRTEPEFLVTEDYLKTVLYSREAKK